MSKRIAHTGSVYDLNFEVYTNCDFNRDSLTLFVNVFQSGWDGEEILWRNSGVGGETKENWITFRKNHNRDPLKANDPEQGFFYYPFIIEVSSKIRVPTQPNLDKQLAFCRKIQETLKSRGCLTVVSSSFEHLL